jgi:Sec7-like guanine-nucleotide exchange factor
MEQATEFVWYDSDISSTLSSMQDLPQESIETTATEYAQRIWDEDQTVYDNLDNIVEWIGNGKPLSHAILESYMSHFDFEEMKLEEAFRSLCSKLHFKGETQQIDRILLQFSARYFECNPQCLFGSTGK